VGRAIERLSAAGVEISLFVDPDQRQIEAAKLLGAGAVEIQTARYSEARTPDARGLELSLLEDAARYAVEQGLHIHLGHGLNYSNVQAVCQIAGVEELNIGHSIVARAVLVGMEQAVREMRQAIRHATRARP
jgi:pyridoxine 5-phosphate synthase